MTWCVCHMMSHELKSPELLFLNSQWHTITSISPIPMQAHSTWERAGYEAGLQQETTCLCEGVAGGGRKRNRKGCEGWGRREGAEKWKELREREGEGIQKSKGKREKGNKLFSLLQAKIRIAVAINKSIGCQNQLSPGQRFESLPIQFWSVLQIVDHNQWH